MKEKEEEEKKEIPEHEEEEKVKRTKKTVPTPNIRSQPFKLISSIHFEVAFPRHHQSHGCQRGHNEAMFFQQQHDWSSGLWQKKISLDPDINR